TESQKFILLCSQKLCKTIMNMNSTSLFLSSALTTGLRILHMPPLLTRHLIRLQPFVFPSQDRDQIHAKQQHLCNIRQLLMDSPHLGNTYKVAEIKGNAFILNKETFFE
ncbi:unnamed protein product, partial [Bubo scandiacus]